MKEMGRLTRIPAQGVGREALIERSVMQCSFVPDLSLSLLHQHSPSNALFTRIKAGSEPGGWGEEKVVCRVDGETSVW